MWLNRPHISVLLDYLNWEKNGAYVITIEMENAQYKPALKYLKIKGT